MSHSDDVFWRQLCDLDDPTQEQMARAEAALAQQGEVAPLPEREVERLVTRAVRGWRVRGAAAARNTTRRWMMLAAGVVLVSVTTLVLWNSRQNSDETLPYENALLLAGDSSYDDEARLSALFNIARQSQQAIEALLTLTRDPDPRVADEARRIREGSLGLLNSAPPAPGQGDVFAPDLANLLRTVQDPYTPIETRLSILAEIDRFLSVSLRAIASCDMTTPHGIQSHNALMRICSDNLAR